MYTLAGVDAWQHPSRSETYVLALERLSTGLAAITSDQQLALFDGSRLSAGPIVSLPTPHGNVTALAAYDWQRGTVCTAGEDGSVAVWDLRQGAGAAAAVFRASQISVLSLACSGESNTIAVGTALPEENSHANPASVVLWDVRSSPQEKVKWDEVHSDDVTVLHFHPSEAYTLLSGSTDGLVNTYDTRIADQDDVIVQTFNHDASVHHANFLTGTDVFAISHDERFALYSMLNDHTSRGGATTDFGDVRSRLGCQYVADVAVKTDGGGAIVGAGSQDRQTFDLIHLTRGGDTPWTLDQGSQVGLPGAHGQELVRAFCFLDEAQVVFTAGEDGAIRSWR